MNRYSLLLCFRKRDSLPYYNSNLANVDIYQKEKSPKYSSSLINQSNSIRLSKPTSLQQITSLLVQKQQKPKSIVYQSSNNSKLSLDHMQQKYIIKPSSTTTIIDTTPIDHYKTKTNQNRRHILSNNLNNKHFNLLSLDEAALKYCHTKHKSNNQTESLLVNLKPQNSIQESDDTGSFHDYYFEDLSSLFDSSPMQASIKAQLSISPNALSDEPSSQSLNKLLTSQAPLEVKKPINSASIEVTNYHPIASPTAVLAKQMATESFLTNKVRQINPLSSYKRNMFVQSRRYPNHYTAHVDSTGELASIANNHDFENTSPTPNNTLTRSPLASTLFEQPEPVIAICSNQLTNVNTIPVKNCTKQNDSNAIDPNLLNPQWIPAIVRKTLLDLHLKAVSKSESNIKSNTLKGNTKKKPLSLQNSEDRTFLVRVNSPTSLPTLKNQSQKSTKSKTKCFI